MTSRASAAFDKLRDVNKVLQIIATRSKYRALKLGDLFKGTTIRDVGDKMKPIFMERPQPSTGKRPATAMLLHQSGYEEEARGYGEGGAGAAVQGGGFGDPDEVEDGDGDGDGDGAAPDAARRRRLIVVAHRLPLRAEPNPSAPYGFDFSLDADALPLQFSRDLPEPLVFVGALPTAAESIPPSQELAAHLLATFSFMPVFLGVGLHEDFYDGFCRGYLLPQLRPHSSCGGGGGLGFRVEHYRAYLTANSEYADRVYELMNHGEGEDLIFIHGYHLWALPTILRHKLPRARIGFFLHSPFPTTIREDLVLALLEADLVGFEAQDYARRFISICSNVFGLPNHSRRGNICIKYLSRPIVVKILSVGVNMDQLRGVLSSMETAAKCIDIATKFAGLHILLSVDNIDLTGGIGRKLRAMEKLLERRPDLCGQVVIIQINNPPLSHGQEPQDIRIVRYQLRAIGSRINARFGLAGYSPIVMIDKPLTMHERLAYYTSADICIVTGEHDGLSRIPYIYTVCRQEGPIAGGLAAGASRQSAIVLSEFVGCSASLSGAVRVNPWNVDDLTKGMCSALMLNECDRQMNHEKRYKYVMTHDVEQSDQDLPSASKDILSVGLAVNFRLAVLGPNFQRSSPGDIGTSYNRSRNRLILLDYDGTVMPEWMIIRHPSHKLIHVLNKLCSDPRNTVFVVSGRGKDELAGWLAPCERLGISAEHGYFTRWRRDFPWVSPNFVGNFDWKNIVEPIMRSYTDATDGSYIEIKEASIVWHYEEADPDFGSCQAKELQGHLLNVLSDEPVSVKSGHKIVEVIPQDVGKGTAARDVIVTMGAHRSLPDFILCVNDQTADQDMFAQIIMPFSNFAFPDAAEIFGCTLGNKGGLLKYVEDSANILTMLLGPKA